MNSDIYSYKNKLLASLIIILILGFLTTSLVSFYISRNSVRDQIDNGLPLISDNIYSEIQKDIVKPVLISSVMANDTFLKDWVTNGEKDPEKMTQYLKKINLEYNTFTSFFVSDMTNIYYQSHGILKKISPTEERDKWYFRVKNMKQDYEINIDPDMANNDEFTVFINYKVYDNNNNFIGATGVGLSLKTVRKIIDKYQAKYNREIIFTDSIGNIQIASIDMNGIRNISSLKGINDKVKEILENDNYLLQYKSENNIIRLNARYVPELNWHLLVQQSEALEFGDLINALLLNVIICIFITLIAIIIFILAFKKYQKRIDNLSEIELEQKKELEQALLEVRQLSGLLPICSGCKKIRDDKGKWIQLEKYIGMHSEAIFSHGICPDCGKKLYGLED